MLIIGLWQIPKLLKKEQNRDLLTFLALWIIATVYGSLVLAEIPLISPIEIITKLITTLRE